ncbi:unnamed protein product [Discula destructiva]
MDAPKDLNPELESFREQWRAEVRARKPFAPSSGPHPQSSSSTSHAGPAKKSAAPGPPRPTVHFGTGKPKVTDTDEDDVEPRAFDEPEPVKVVRQTEKENNGEPVTALDHYERAVEKETQGSLGDSLMLYRKAFRMDHKVDKDYRNKHFAEAWSKPVQATKPAAATQQTTQAASKSKPLTIDEMVASFSDLSIEPAAPPIEGMPQPPCPIASLPEEILIHILQSIASSDVGEFVRLSRVCKRFAWLVATEDSVWRQVCLGSKFGFTGMVYDFRTRPDWRPIPKTGLSIADADAESDPEELARLREEQVFATSIALLNTTYQSSWQGMFRRRPRMRFNGCYISTINYIRPGQQVSYVTWNNSPVHIVTYYRYLRVFRDGTAISLCTVEEPASVVHHMSKENMARHKNGALPHLPSSVMQHALPARWKLSSAADYEGKEHDKEASLADAEGDLFIESDGGGNYLYRMELSLRSAGKGSRNNKLMWRGFFSFNKTHETWDEFTLKSDNSKPWFFSRVKSYGFGED